MTSTARADTGGRRPTGSVVACLVRRLIVNVVHLCIVLPAVLGELDDINRGEYVCPASWRRIPEASMDVEPAEMFRWATCVRPSDAALPWDDAMAECRGQSGHLLVLADTFYNRYSDTDDSAGDEVGTDVIYNQLKQFINETGFTSTWVGLHGAEKDSVWWEAETPIKYRSSSGRSRHGDLLWMDFERGRKSCGAILDVASSTDAISMIPCERSMNFVCIRPAINVLLSTYESEAQCGEDWLWSDETDVCYQRQDTQMTFSEALAHCESLGGTVATPTDGLMHNFTTAAFAYPGVNFRSLPANATFWIGLRPNGRTASGDSWSYSYGDVLYDKKSTKSGCLTVRMNGFWPVGWFETSCDQELDFVCQKPKTLLGEPRFLTQPIDAWISSSELSGFQLGCRASNVHQRRSVVWVKSSGRNSSDGLAYVDNGRPTRGFFLDLELVSQFLAIDKITKLQGYYRCEVWNADGRSRRGRFHSETALVTFEDIITLRGSIVGHPDTLLRSLRETASSLMARSNLRYEIDYDVTSDATLPNPTLNFSVFIRIGDSELSSNHDHLTTSRDRRSVVNDDVKTKWKSYVTDRIFRSVMRALNVDRPDYVESVSIRRTDSCADIPMEAAGNNVVTFPVTLLGRSASSRQLCVFDGVPLAVGQCVGDFTTGGRWTIVSRHACDEQNAPFAMKRSRVTDRLAQLDSVHIQDDSLPVVTSALANLTRDADELTALDVSYSASVFGKISELSIGSKDHQASRSLMDAVNSLSRVPGEELYQAELLSKACTRIVSSLEAITDNIVLSPSSNFSASRPNIAVTVFDLSLNDDNNWIHGVGVEIDHLTDGVKPLLSTTSPGDVAGRLGGAILVSRDMMDMGRAANDMYRRSMQNGRDNKFRVSFIVHRDGALFPQQDKHVGSFVLSASINGLKIDNLTEPVALVFRLKQDEMKANKSSSQICAFWDVVSGSTPTWSTAGISTDTSMMNDSDTVVCYSRHLTNFAVIAGFDMPRDTVVAKVLEAISLVGLSLSIVGLALTILSQIVLYRKLKRANSQLVLLHLSVSLLAVDVLVIGGLDKVDGPPAVCKTVAALLLYFLLVSFSWMLVEAVVQYLKFVKVFNTYTSRFMLKTALPSYLLPGVIVVIVALIDVTGGETLRGPSSYCWLSRDAFNFAFLLPLGLVMVTNIVLFVLIVKGLTCDRGVGLQSNQSKTELVKLQVMALICCFIVMGLTWVFAFFAVDEAATTMHFLFCIFNSLQGFLIFAFLNVRERLVRRAWMRLLTGCCRRAGRESVSGESKSADTGRAATGSGTTDRRLPNRASARTESESRPMMTSRSDGDKPATDTTDL